MPRIRVVEIFFVSQKRWCDKLWIMYRCSVSLLSHHWPRAQGSLARAWELGAPWWQPCLQVVQSPPPALLALLPPPFPLSRIVKTGLCLKWSWAQLKTAQVWLLAAAILFLAARWPLTIISPRILQTQKCLQFSHQGKGTVSWSVQEHFVNWGGVCRCLHLSKKKTCWWAWVLLSAWAAEPFRASRALKKTPVDTALLPSAAVVVHLAAHTMVCVQCLPSPACAGGCTESIQAAVCCEDPKCYSSSGRSF